MTFNSDGHDGSRDPDGEYDEVDIEDLLRPEERWDDPESGTRREDVIYDVTRLVVLAAMRPLTPREIGDQVQAICAASGHEVSPYDVSHALERLRSNLTVIRGASGWTAVRPPRTFSQSFNVVSEARVAAIPLMDTEAPASPSRRRRN